MKNNLEFLEFLLETSILVNSSDANFSGSNIAVWKYLPINIGFVKSLGFLKLLGSLSSVIISEEFFEKQSLLDEKNEIEGLKLFKEL